VPPKVGRSVAKIKQFRAIATRYEKTARNFLAAVHLVASVVWLN
jgi:transposase